MKQIKSGLIVALGIFSLTLLGGCTSIINAGVGQILKADGNDHQKVKEFEQRFDVVIKNVKHKKDYKKIPFKGTKDTEWFIKQSFALWDKQQTKQQYVANGDARYPGYTQSFEYLADEFLK